VISSERPGWVVARLWEELRSRLPDALETLGYWLDIRQEIGKPSVVPTEVWDKKTIEAFTPLLLSTFGLQPWSVGTESSTSSLSRWPIFKR
jgi:hypothetical protein